MKALLGCCEMNSKLWFILLKIAELEPKGIISTTYLGELLGKSQQSISRYIRDLEKEDLITRTITPKGQRIVLTEKGVNMLREVYYKLKVIFKEEPSIYVLKGKVFTGLGEGAYYVSQKGYKSEFERKLGFQPYPGTLNLRLTDESQIKIRKTIEAMPGVIVESFRNKNRSFGTVKCFKVSINDTVKGALIFIQRTHYADDVVEVISDKNLRETLNLKDGDIVKLTVNL